MNFICNYCGDEFDFDVCYGSKLTVNNPKKNKIDTAYFCSPICLSNAVGLAKAGMMDAVLNSLIFGKEEKCIKEKS